jgi:predicted DNA-binding protein
MESEKTNAQINLRVTEELKKRLEAEAKTQGRPLANYIKAIINQHMNELDKAKKIAEQR